LITGDDILIEYVERLMKMLKILQPAQVGDAHQESIESFITHYVWHCKDKRDT
jgi:hypothetical protein